MKFNFEIEVEDLLSENLYSETKISSEKKEVKKLVKHIYIEHLEIVPLTYEKK